MCLRQRRVFKPGSFNPVSTPIHQPRHQPDLSMLRVTTILGCAADAALADRLHDIEHRGGLETVRLTRSDMARRRQQLRTDRGSTVALILDRDATLQNGSVLWLDDERAVVVLLDEPHWLVLQARTAADALELGYFAGNMHWKVKFDGERLCIALDGPRDTYLQRLAHLIQRGCVTVPDEAGPGAGSEPPPPAAHGTVRYIPVPHAH